MRKPALLCVVFWCFAVMSSMGPNVVPAAETIDDTPGQMSWGVGDHYKLPIDSDGWSIVEPGRMHRKIYAAADGTRDASGLSPDTPVDLKTGIRHDPRTKLGLAAAPPRRYVRSRDLFWPNMLGESPLCPILRWGLRRRARGRFFAVSSVLSRNIRAATSWSVISTCRQSGFSLNPSRAVRESAHRKLC